jgi:hypothetical protein
LCSDVTEQTNRYSLLKVTDKRTNKKTDKSSKKTKKNYLSNTAVVKVGKQVNNEVVAVPNNNKDDLDDD